MNNCLIKTIEDNYKKGVKVSSEEVWREEFAFDTDTDAVSYCINTYDLEGFVRKTLQGQSEEEAQDEDSKYYILLVQIEPEGEMVIASLEPLGVWKSEMLREIEEEKEQ